MAPSPAVSSPLDSLASIVSIVNRAAIVISGAVLALMAIHIILDVGFRYVAGRPLHGTTEIVSHYDMVVIVFLPLAYIQAHDRHIHTGLVADALPPRALPLLQAFSALLMGVFAALFAWRGGVEALRATDTNERIQTALFFIPTWPGRWLLTIAVALVVLQSAVDVAVKARAFLRWPPRGAPGIASRDAPGAGS